MSHDSVLHQDSRLTSSGTVLSLQPARLKRPLLTEQQGSETLSTFEESVSCTEVMILDDHTLSYGKRTIPSEAGYDCLKVELCW